MKGVGSVLAETSEPLTVIVTFDRLTPLSLGAYGNEWVDTPHLDRLATQGWTFQRHFGDDPDLTSIPAWWTLRSELRPSNRLVLLQERASGWPSGSEPDRWFETVFSTGPLPEHAREFPFPRMVTVAIDRLAEGAGPLDVLWLHSRGVPEPWNVPKDLATLYFEDFEEQGWALEEISQEDWGSLWPVYGSYVSLLDHALGRLIDRLNCIALARPVRLIVTAAAGSRIDSIHPGPAELHGVELATLQCPLLVWERGPGVEPVADSRSSMDGARVHQLTTAGDVALTLRQWLKMSPHAGAEQTVPRAFSLEELLSAKAPLRDYVAWRAPAVGWQGLITSDWFYARPLEGRSKTLAEPTDRGSRGRLFVMPDDPWHLLDVARQAGDVAEELEELLEDK